MLIDQNIKFKEYDNPTEIAANDILKGKILKNGFNGRMEFGPRALGARSILADPRSKNMKKLITKKLNLEKNSDHFVRLFYMKILINFMRKNLFSL